MFRGVLRATAPLLDGRNRFPINLKLTQTRKANDRRRIAILKENARIIREGRRALMARLTLERSEAMAASQASTSPTSSDVSTTTPSTSAQ